MHSIVIIINTAVLAIILNIWMNWPAIRSNDGWERSILMALDFKLKKTLVQLRTQIMDDEFIIPIRWIEEFQLFPDADRCHRFGARVAASHPSVLPLFFLLFLLIIESWEPDYSDMTNATRELCRASDRGDSIRHIRLVKWSRMMNIEWLNLLMMRQEAKEGRFHHSIASLLSWNRSTSSILVNCN